VTLQSRLLAKCQKGYEAVVSEICERWAEVLGDEAFEGVRMADFAAAVMDRIEAENPPLNAGKSIDMMGGLLALSAWCGFTVSADIHRQIGLRIRCGLYDSMRHRRDIAPHLSDRPKTHALFAGVFEGPNHSPTRGMVDYGLALLADPEVERLDIYHIGAPNPAIMEYMRRKFATAGDRVHLLALDKTAGLVATVTARGPSIVHIWTEQPFAPKLSFLSMYRPTVMYTCADAPPYQYADVYWFLRDTPYIAAAWARNGVPDAFIANYVPRPNGPDGPERRAQVPRTKAELGFSPDNVVLVSVGNRLAIEMDQAFVGGLEVVLRRHPRALWLVVGALPDDLIGAYRSRFGSQFSHIPYDPNLNALFGACDIFVNPFRAGGGGSAALAMANGAVVLTRGDFGDVGGITPSIHHAQDAGGYFAKLVELIQNPDLRHQWRVVQTEHVERLSDQGAFTQSLREMSDLAWARYRQRVGRPIEYLFDIPPPRSGALDHADQMTQRQTGTGR
jgi:hypothetical protein